jgi:hypothetical protein
MAEKDGRKTWVMVNRTPALTLWAAVLKFWDLSMMDPSYSQKDKNWGAGEYPGIDLILRMLLARKGWNTS